MFGGCRSWGHRVQGSLEFRDGSLFFWSFEVVVVDIAYPTAAMRAMVAGPSSRYTTMRPKNWGDRATPLHLGAKLSLAAMPSALGSGNKSLCQETQKGDL